MTSLRFLFCTIFLLLSVGHMNAQTWQSVDVAASRKNESAPDVAVEAGGTAHIVFKMVSGKVKGKDVFDIGYVNTVGNTLSSPQQVTNVGTSSVGDVSIDLDVGNHVHVATRTVQAAISTITMLAGAFRRQSLSPARPRII